MRHAFTWFVLRGFWLLLLCASTASAQATAQINGTVRDQADLPCPA